MKKVLNLLIFLLLMSAISNNLMAQPENDSSNNYLYINDKFTDFFNDIESTYGTDSLNSYGFKKYFRWNNYWSNRYGENGDMQPIIDATNLYFESPISSVNDGPWEIIGPIGLPPRSDGTHRSTVGKGMVTSLWVNPENRQEIFAGTHTSGLFHTNDGGNTWVSKTDEIAEIQGITQIVQHPINENTFFVLSANDLSGSSYGVFKSTDRCNTWTEFSIAVSNGNIYPTTSNRKFPKKLIFHPDSINIMFLITQSLILKTNDGGISWEEKYNGHFNSWGATSDYITGQCNGYFECILKLKQQEHGFYNIFYNPSSPDTLFANGHILLMSKDFGNTWDSITEEVTGRVREWNIHTNIDDNYPGFFWIHYQQMFSNGMEGDSSFLLKYDIKNGTSEKLFYDGKNARNLIRVSPSDSSKIYLGGQGWNTLHMYDNLTSTKTKIYGLYGSLDYIHVDIRDLVVHEYSPGNDSLIIANDGGVSAGKQVSIGSNDWEYTDLSTLNADWHHHLNITEFYSVDGDESEGEFLIANTQDLNGFYLDTASWVHTGFGDGGGIEIDKTNPNYIYYADYQGYFGRSSNKGKTFSRGGSFSALDANQRIPLALDPDNSNHLYLGERGLRLYYDCMDNFNHIQVNFPHDNNQIITAIEFSESNTEIMYIGTKKQYNWWNTNDTGNIAQYTGCLWKSLDKGNTWIDISSNFGGAYDGFITDICINPFNSNEVWISCAKATSYADNPFRTKKTYHSLNGGQSYETYVEGLPDKIPVYKIKYDKINHHLYIVTDIGVLTRDLLYGNSWEDFNDGLPRKLVNDIYLNLTDKKIIAATYGRSMWKTDLKQTPDCPSFSTTPIHISEDAVWNTPQLINSDVIIDSGYTLTIQSVSFFHAQSKVIVKPGAKLFVDGGTLTNSCDSTIWQGIEVWGNSTGAQNPAEQGWVSINNGMIENATRGIVANNYYIPDAWKDGYTGGIIQAANSVFKNNITAVQFDTYDLWSASWFVNCSFITDEGYPLLGIPFSAFPFAFAKITNHRGAQFNGCSFSNEATDLFAVQNRGIGIYSTDGGFSVGDFSVMQESSFTNLYYGIYGLGVLANNNFYVRDSEFDSYRGVYMSACYNSQLSGNTFTVPISIPGIDNNAYGLYMQNSTAFTVEDNSFTSDEATPTGIGIYINSSGTDENEIYRNNFSNLQFGIIAQDINRNGTIGGLVLKCNTFTAMQSDISVTSGEGPETKNHGIAQNQGANSTDPALMAGNLFYYNNTTIDFDDIDNGLNHINYYYPTNIDPGYFITEPLDYTINTVTKTGIGVSPYWSYTNGCPPSGSSGGDKSALLSQLAVSDFKVDSTLSVLAILVDGGDTQQLTDDVDQSTPPETVTIYNELMGESPYLSDSVVESAVLKEDVLPNAMLRDVMVANAHTAKSDELMNSLDNRWDPMPDYMKAQILQGKSLVSLKEETESCLAAFNLNKARAFYGLTNYFMADTVNAAASTDSLINLLSNSDISSAHYKLALLHFNKGEYTLGSDVLGYIPVTFTLDADKTIEHQNMVDYYNLLTAIKQQDGNIFSPDSVHQQQLWGVINTDSTKAGVFAQNLLLNMGAAAYYEPIILPDLYKSRSAMAEYEQLVNTEEPFMIKVYPNPANGYLIIEYGLETGTNAVIVVRDLTGNVITNIPANRLNDQVVVVTRDWSAGAYIATIEINGQPAESIKFTVIN